MIKGPRRRISEFVNVTDYVANGSFAALKENVTYRNEPDYAILVRLVDHKSKWAGPFVYVDRASFDFLRKSALEPGDVVISNVGANAGTVFRAPNLGRPMTLGPNSVVLKGIAVPRYWYFFFCSPQGQAVFQSIVSGSAQPKFNKTDLRACLVPYPRETYQDKVASTLGALDDKIELNRRMNETLEAMARAIFKDWFVDFGPTRAKAGGRAPYLAPELWNLFPDALDDQNKPVGWAEIQLKQLGLVITGKTPSTKKPEFFGNEMPFLKIPDMRGRVYVLRTSTELSEEGARSQEKKTLPAGSVSVSCIATPGLVTFNHRDTQTNQQINSIIPSDRRQSNFVFWSCRQLASAVMLGGSGGSVFHNMNKTSFENLRLVYPGQEMARTYSNTVSQMHGRMLSNEYESNTLAQTRDLLLPKLMSGEIRLADAEMAVEAVA